MPDYQYYRRALQGLPLPLAYLDLDLLDDNITAILSSARNLPIRIATKSVRCTHVLRYLLSSSSQFQGLMTFSIPESLFLADNGFDDLLVGYPNTNRQQLAALVTANLLGKTIIPMVDCREQMQRLQDAAEEIGFDQPVCVDVDMSSKFPLLHFGAHRSPLDSIEKFRRFLDDLDKMPRLKLVGIMGYEAQIAGVGDASPFNGLKNPLIKLLKRRSIPELTKRRQQAYKLAVERGHPICLVNGGGTGSIDSTRQDTSVTEITVGSGFYCSALFDYYSSFRLKPAAGFALEVTRQWSDHVFTLSGGGYIASGSINPDKQPVPYLPAGVKLFKDEGAGEVQSPFTYTGVEPLGLGDPVFMRHAKAGELCERFQQLHLIRAGKVVQIVPTYRGQGQCFL